MIGERLKKARKNKGLKQSVLAHLVGVAASEISQYETGRKFPKKDHLCTLLDVLDVSADYILGRDESVISNNTDYIIHLSSKDLEILSKIKHYKKLYYVLCSERMEDIIREWARRF